MAMLADTVELVIGVDTHKHTHTAAVVTAATGAVMGQLTVPATPAGYRQLLQLAGQRAALSVRLAARRSAVQAASDAQRQLHALVVAAPEALHGRLRNLTTPRLVATCGRLRPQAAWDVETAATAASLRAPGPPCPTPAHRDRQPHPGHHRPGPSLAARSAQPPRGGPDRGHQHPVRLVPSGPLPHRCRLRHARRGRAYPASSG
jgi:hypothetical protein